jgi:MFS family permease
MWSLPAVLFFFAFFHRVAPGVIARDVMQEFRVGAAVFGLLSATYFYAYAAGMIPAGVLLDAFGARRVIAAGGAVMGAGTLLMGAAASTPALFTGRFLVGLGATVTFVGALKVAATWFAPSRFGLLSAVTATVGVVGALVATAPLAALIAITGWRGALLLVGGVTLAGSAACLLALRDRPAGAAAETPPTLGAALAGMVAVLRNRDTWPPFLAFFCLYSAMGNLQLWAVPYLRDVYGKSNTEAALFAAAPSLALIVTAPLTGFVSDRVLRRRKAPYLALNAGLLVLWILFVATLGVLPSWGVYAVLLGMGAVGGSFVLTWPIGREVNPPHLAGIAVAVVNLGGFLGAAVTQAPLGALLDTRWAGALVQGARSYPIEAYRAAFLACAGFVLGAALLSLLLKETRGRNIYAEARRR